jgi:hypothetical protein
MHKTINVAYRKNAHATVSKEWPESYALYATDGFSTRQACHSAYVGSDDGNTQPEFLLDLGTSYPIDEITLTSPSSWRDRVSLKVQLYNGRLGEGGGLDADWRSSSACVYTETVVYSNITSAIKLATSVNARYLAITCKEEFALNEVRVMAINPLGAQAGQKADDLTINLIDLLATIEMYWGSDIDLIDLIEALRAEPPIELLNVAIDKLNERQVDIGFYIESLDSAAHLSTVFSQSGSCNLLLMLNIPRYRLTWREFFWPHLETQSSETDALGNRVFSTTSKFMIPLGGATKELIEGDEVPLEGIPLKAVSSIDMQLSGLTTQAKIFLSDLIDSEADQEMEFRLEAGINFLAPMDLSLLPISIRRQYNQTGFDSVDSIISGLINTKLLDLFKRNIVDPQKLWLHVVLPSLANPPPKPPATANIDMKTDFLIHAHMNSDGQYQLEATLHRR